MLVNCTPILCTAIYNMFLIKYIQIVEKENISKLQHQIIEDIK